MSVETGSLQIRACAHGFPGILNMIGIKRFAQTCMACELLELLLQKSPPLGRLLHRWVFMLLGIAWLCLKACLSSSMV
ncbi:MAG: hypothetical protein RJA72_1040, partial [Pseudomonadota bacterium]